MTTLLSLPRLSHAALQATSQAAMPLRMGVSAATRARAATRLQLALLQGRIAPSAAIAAMEEGDLAVARLLEPLTIKTSVPQVHPEALASLPTTRQLPPDVLQPLLGIARQLVADGDLAADDLIALAEGTPDTVAFLVAIERAWQRRCTRLTERLLPEGVRVDADYCYGISLVPVLDALDALAGDHYTPMAMLDERLPSGVMCELVAWPLVVLPAHPVEQPDFFRAFMGVWNALVVEGRTPLVAPLDTALFDMTGGFGEALGDAVVSATWTKGVPSFTAAAREQLREEFDIDIDAHADAFTQYAAWMRAAKADPWSPRSKAYNTWVHERATPAQAALLATLRAITACLHKALSHLPIHGQTAWAGDGCIAVCLQPTDFGVDDFLTPYLENMYESGEMPLWQCAPPEGVQDPAQLLALADRVILEAVAFTACRNEIAHYVP